MTEGGGSGCSQQRDGGGLCIAAEIRQKKYVHTLFFFCVLTVTKVREVLLDLWSLSRRAGVILFLYSRSLKEKRRHQVQLG